MDTFLRMFSIPYAFLFVFLLLSLLLILLHEEARRRILAQRDHERRAMLGILSHQLRTPLTGIQWYTELLQEPEAGRALSTEQRQLVDQISVGSCDAIRVLNRFIEVFQATRGGFVARPVEVDVRIVLGQVMESLAPLVQERKHLLVVFGDDGEVMAHIDPLLLQGVLDALLANAIYYTPPGGKISVTLEQKKHDIVVTVEDTGIGIGKEEQKKVFIEFFRGDRAKLLHPSGCGLGLSFAKQLLEQNQGSLRFASEEGKGTTFTVTVPRERR